MIQVEVTRRYTINFDGSAEDYIRLADSLTPNGLDSLDCGDATGQFVHMMNLNLSDWNYKLTYDSFVTGKTHTAKIEWNDDNFHYTHGENNIGTQLTDDELIVPTATEIARILP